MISYILRKAPGPWWLKALILVAITAAVFYLLFENFYPWVHETFDGDMTVSQSGATSGG